MNNKNAVVLAGDYAYIRQIETALKSLCYHNRQLKIYLFNQDIPVEWFRATREHVERLGGELLDIKLIGPQFQMNWTNKLGHINHMTLHGILFQILFRRIRFFIWIVILL